MASPLSARERDTYEAMWAVESYRSHSPGEAYLPLFLDMAKPSMRGTILDAGCGSGKGALALKAAGFDVTLCDLTNTGLEPDAKGLPFIETALWNDLRPQRRYQFGGKYAYVYCTDVLEHIPTPFTMLVVSRLLEVARHGVFFSISLMPDAFGAWVGKPLHQTVQSFPQWFEQLDTIGEVKEGRDLLHCGVFWVVPK